MAAPVTVVTSPTGVSPVSGVSCNVTGTASDAGTGVASIEVSTDGSATWHLATDTSGAGTWSTWSYNWSLGSNGTYTVMSRATDF
ncbi:MAG: hypothetical protein HZA22_04000, partial [Nitrospirae bacterium]|nr:hypothetical protein [Nitrospirota bacterium]